MYVRKRCGKLYIVLFSINTKAWDANFQPDVTSTHASATRVLCRRKWVVGAVFQRACSSEIDLANYARSVLPHLLTAACSGGIVRTWHAERSGTRRDRRHAQSSRSFQRRAVRKARDMICCVFTENKKACGTRPVVFTERLQPSLKQHPLLSTFWPIKSLLSPNTCLRSEWPRMTHSMPLSLSMAGLSTTTIITVLLWSKTLCATILRFMTS